MKTGWAYIKGSRSNKRHYIGDDGVSICRTWKPNASSVKFLSANDNDPINCSVCRKGLEEKKAIDEIEAVVMRFAIEMKERGVSVILQIKGKNGGFNFVSAPLSDVAKCHELLDKHVAIHENGKAGDSCQ